MVETFDDSDRARRSGLRDEERAESWDLRPGMAVAGSDGHLVGQVKEVRSTDFLVNRRLKRDVYVPYAACQAVEGDRVVLTVAAAAVDDQEWANPGPDAPSAPEPPPPPLPPGRPPTQRA